jgi:hypothetical protein
MAVFLRRFVVSHHSQQLQKSIGSLLSIQNAASRRCLSSRGKPPVAPRGFQSSRERRAERTRQSNAAGGWLVFCVAMAGGSISAVVMAYTEGAELESPVQRQRHTDSSSGGDEGKNKTFPTKSQQFNLMSWLEFDD